MKCGKCGADNPGDTRFCGQCGAALVQTPPTSGWPPSPEEGGDAPTRTLITTTSKIRIGANFAGRYHILEELGRGGMGKVYKALDTKIDETIAIKILNPEVAANLKSRRRFREELKTTRQISHRHICRVYDFSEEDDQAFFTMEYVSGEDLKSLIRRVGQLTPGKAVFVARQIAEGLNEAHRMGVIHRDLKPHNIMIDKDGNVRIMDFGIARSFKNSGMTDTGVIIGTPEYMSPEQVDGKEADSRSDIYSMGIILYEMLTGRVPFAGDTPLSVAVKQKTERPLSPRRLNPQIPQEVNRIILQCLEKDRRLRFQDADQLWQELVSIEKSLPKTDQVVPERKTRSTREITVKLNLNRVFVPALVVVFLALITFVAWKMIAKRDIALFAEDKPSLAVLHFENNTGDTNLAHWRKALSDLLIADLSQSRLLQVLSAERMFDIMEELDIVSAVTYSSDDLKALARRGGVRYVLVGKMTKAGDIIRLNTTLQEAQTGEVIGSEQVEGEGENSLFSLVDELTTRIKGSFQLSAEKIAADLDAKVEEITTTSTEAHRYYNEGMTYHNRGDYTKSIPLMELAVAIDPEFAMAYRAMSAAYSNLGYQAEAERRLDKAFELKDRVSERERYYIEADYYRRSEETYDKAISAYEKLLELYPDDHVGNNNLGVVFNSIEEFEKAIECFEVNVRNQTQNYHSYSNLITAYLNTGRLGKAEAVAKSYISNSMDHPQIRNSLARIYLYQEKYQPALEEAEKALSLDAGALDAIITKGNIHFLENDLPAAQAEYLKLLEIEQPIAHIYGRALLGDYYLAQGRFLEAETQFRQGLDLADLVGESTWISSLQAQLGYLYSIRGSEEAALSACRDSVQSAQESGILSKQREALFNAALVQIHLKKTEEARRTAQSLEEVTAQGLNLKAMRQVYLIKGLLLKQGGKYSDALTEFKRAEELMPVIDPGRMLLSDATAETLWADGHLDKAQRFYRNIRRRPLARLESGYLYAQNYYQNARLCQELGKEEEARFFYRKFLELWSAADPDIPMLEDARNQLQSLSR